MAAADGPVASTPPESESSVEPQSTEGEHPGVGEIAGEEVPDLGTAPSEEPPASPAEPEISQAERATAAVAEQASTNHIVVFRAGEITVDVQCPPKMPASFKFRIGALDDNDPVVLRVIRKLIGSEQWEQIMDALDDAGFVDEGEQSSEEADAAVGNFVNDVAASYGMTPGESQASPTS